MTTNEVLEYLKIYIQLKRNLLLKLDKSAAAGALSLVLSEIELIQHQLAENAIIKTEET
jgi:hypothetical protein